jgi:hypothetical protein
MAPAPEIKNSIPQDNALTSYEKELVIDNFDDADIKAAPAWWTFDALEGSFPEAKNDANGFYYMKLSGQANNYYIGGMGTYVGKDLGDYDTLVISVLGTGPNSGTLRLQLYDDDNSTYQLEQDNTYRPLYDDYLEYELPVTWEGWQTVEIPLNKFVDMNQGVGDDIFNPEQKNGSGGLLHFQFVVLATSEKGKIDLGIDSIKFVKKINK